MKRQSGVGALGIVFILIAIGFVALLIMKLAPVYLENWSIKKVLSTMQKDPEVANMTPKEIRASFDRRALIDDIHAVKGDDLDISRDAGITTIQAIYAVKVPLFANVNVCIDFKESATK